MCWFVNHVHNWPIVYEHVINLHRIIKAHLLGPDLLFETAGLSIVHFADVKVLPYYVTEISCSLVPNLIR